MKLLNKGIYILSFLLLSIPFACTEEEDDFSIIEGLSFTVHTISTDGTKTGVIPTTVPGDGRVVFTVDFGDPAAEADDDVFQTSGPMVTYKYPKESLTYTITVTASLEGKDDVSITKEHAVKFVVEKPSTPGSPLEGTWKMAPKAGALGVGPGLNDMSWWASDAATVTGRACFFDDEYVFNADGTFQNVLGSETWLEKWQTGATEDACGAPIFPHDGSASATYEYNESAGTITLTGKGAYLGIPKAVNGEELTNPGDAPDEVTYLAELSEDGNTLEIDIEIGGGGHWSFTLAKELPPAVEGTWKMAPKAGALGVGPGLNNMSWWASDAATVTDRACFFDDEYVFNADGTFQNVLGSETWLEKWQTGATEDACGAPIFPHDGSASATYEYNESAGTITLTGKGAYLGIPKAVNGEELTNPGDAPDEVTYLAELSEDGNTLEIDIEIGGGGHWSFTLARVIPPTGVQGTWKMAPKAGALGVGPGLNNMSWWASDAATVTDRACFFDDEYVFNADGTFQNVLGSETWLEKWQTGATEDACGAPIFPHDGSASATYEYNESAGTITLTGKGAYLGIPKAVNGEELTNPGDAPDEVTYLAELSEDGNTLEIDIEIGGGGHWSFTLARE